MFFAHLWEEGVSLDPVERSGRVGLEYHTLSQNELEPETRAFYCQVLTTLREAQAPFLAGGAYVLECYTGITRHTKDLDIFVCPSDWDPILGLLATAGYRTERTFPHWLGKASQGEHFIDVIFGSGNGMCKVDDDWFARAVAGSVFEIPVKLCPPEEIIWSKSFIMERERYDGADIAHLIRACSERLDWLHLLTRFGPHWRVLLSHLLLFGYIYPAEHARIPGWLMDELVRRLHCEQDSPLPAERLCQGTLLSREQYLTDIQRWGYLDARLFPQTYMTPEEIARWTAAIGREQ